MNHLFVSEFRLIFGSNPGGEGQQCSNRNIRIVRNNPVWLTGRKQDHASLLDIDDVFIITRPQNELSLPGQDDVVFKCARVNVYRSCLLYTSPSPRD